ncbi:MAG: hypothetical protein AABW56_02365 [Nanoarchaeota archaeon]
MRYKMKPINIIKETEERYSEDSHILAGLDRLEALLRKDKSYKDMPMVRWGNYISNNCGTKTYCQTSHVFEKEFEFFCFRTKAIIYEFTTKQDKVFGEPFNYKSHASNETRKNGVIVVDTIYEKADIKGTSFDKTYKEYCALTSDLVYFIGENLSNANSRIQRIDRNNLVSIETIKPIIVNEHYVLKSLGLNSLGYEIVSKPHIEYEITLKNKLSELVFLRTKRTDKHLSFKTKNGRVYPLVFNSFNRDSLIKNL